MQNRVEAMKKIDEELIATSRTIKSEESAEIQADVDAFLASGGVINSLDIGQRKEVIPTRSKTRTRWTD